MPIRQEETGNRQMLFPFLFYADSLVVFLSPPSRLSLLSFAGPSVITIRSSQSLKVSFSSLCGFSTMEKLPFSLNFLFVIKEKLHYKTV